MAQKFLKLLNTQVAHEYAAHQQYVAMGVWFDSQALPQFARFFYRQALEERNHAMMIVQYLLDRNAEAIIPGIDPPKNDFADIVEPVALALQQEKKVSGAFDELAEVAVVEADHKGFYFVQWFLKEQIEEVATMTDLLKTVERSKDTPLLIEDFLAREAVGEPGPVSFEPTPAGGKL